MYMAAYFSCEPGWVMYRRASVLLSPSVFDLLAVSALIKRRRGLRSVTPSTPVFEAAFSRAVKGLIQRGRLVKPGLVPIESVEKDPHGIVHRLSDGMYLDVHGRTRFVQASTVAAPGSA
jgi:hypothetical protein